MKNTMKQWIALLLTVLLCLSVAACGKEPAPVDEDVSSLLNGEEIISNAEQEETRNSVEDVEQVVAEAPKNEGEKTESKLEVPKEPLTELKETEPKTPSATANVSSNPSTSQEQVEEKPLAIFQEMTKHLAGMTSGEQLDTPPEGSIPKAKHVDSITELEIWLNSEEALTEDNGVYADAVNFYRKKGSFLGVSAFEGREITWCTMGEDGVIIVAYEKEGYVEIRPFSTEEALTATNGIVSHLQAQGASVAQTKQETDLASITRDNPDYYVQRPLVVGSKQKEAVYRIIRREIIDDDTGEIEEVYFARRFYWIQNGFRVEVVNIVTGTAEKAWNYDQEFVSSLSFREVALSASPLQAAK